MEAKFKVGDNVIVLTDAFTKHKFDLGVIATIDGQDSFSIKFKNGDVEPFSAKEFEHSKNYVVTQILNDL